VGQKSKRGAESCHFQTNTANVQQNSDKKNCKLPTEETIGAQNFDFAPKMCNTKWCWQVATKQASCTVNTASLKVDMQRTCVIVIWK